MKKVLSLILALVLMVSLAACMVSDGTADSTEENDVVNDSIDSSENVNTDEIIDEIIDFVDGEQATIDEVVLVDEADVKITATELSYDSIFGVDLKLLVENNSDTDLTFQSRNTSVNGYMIDTMMSIDVASGKKANDTLTFMASDLEMCDIDTIADMEFAFHVFTTDDWEAYLDTEQISITTSAADGFEYSYDDAGTLVYEGDDIKILSKGLTEDDSLLGSGVVLYIYNSGDSAVTVQTRDVSINGFMVDPIFSEDVFPGKHAITAVTFLSSELEDNGIAEISEIELSFHLFDSESWDTIEDTEKVTLTF